MEIETEGFCNLAKEEQSTLPLILMLQWHETESHDTTASTVLQGSPNRAHQITSKIAELPYFKLWLAILTSILRRLQKYKADKLWNVTHSYDSIGEITQN